MSNLGWYQKITTAAKAVGGPKRLFGLVLVGGAAVGVGGTIVTTEGTDSNGLVAGSFLPAAPRTLEQGPNW